MQSVKVNRECRICQSDDVEEFLDLGRTPLANAFLKRPDPAIEPRYPLNVYFCRQCAHVQLMHVVRAEALFQDYIYVSSTSDTLRAHFAELAAQLVERQDLRAGDLVVEIASNDGILLKELKKHDVRAVGVEPAVNLADLSRQQGLEVVNAFFDLNLARAMRQLYGPVRVITGSNVMGHVDRLRDFVRGIAHLLEDEGLLCIEVPYLFDLLRGGEFDTIYHEHLSYFSLTAIQRLFAEAGLWLADVERVPVHGGTLRVFARRSSEQRQPSTQVKQMLAAEETEGIRDFSTYQQFSVSVAASREALTGLIRSLKSEGKRIAGYGAAAKGNTLLNYCDLGRDVIDYVIDKNPLKQGLFTPGTSLPVYPPERLLEDKPDYLLILAWNFSEEIVQQQQDFLASGGKFIIPAPQLKVLELSHTLA